MVPANRLPDALTVSRLLASLSFVLAGVAAVVLLFPQPMADAFFAAWVLFAVLLAVFGAIGAWARRSALVWVAALLLSGLTVVGMWSIGGFIAPAALGLLGAAVATLWTGSRPGAHEAVVEDPPSVLEAVTKSLAGTVLVVAGAALAYEGTVVRELFTRGCSSETLACALAVMRLDAVGLSILGLATVGSGGWLVWRQVAVVRVLASSHDS
jgi:hypothetical protein